MAWNEPDGNNNDPENKGKKEQGPPDLDELLKICSISWEGVKVLVVAAVVYPLSLINIIGICFQSGV